MDSNHPAHDSVINDKYIFQGVYMLWETYDGNTQFQGKLELWNYGDLSNRPNLRRRQPSSSKDVALR